MTRTDIPNLPMRVLVVDDSVEWRQYIRTMLEMLPGELQVVGEASDGFQAVQKAEELGPNLILLDIGLPGLNGIEAATRISAIAPGSKILFLSQNDDTDVVRAALQEGACGYVLKSDANRELLAAVAAVLRGEGFISHSLAST